ncbi:TDP-N-acetylfucosamine:lipid II N-acetylfucosaminyltransferase [Chryseobacterium sp. POL2]|uniref:TDP-N-acetylfucosamine:lipid II N-acetylfucosaminyltransferase n=1 Tax=Chryseobacterium sp. POL2 TaxID=2713414 RepID=UPI0013E13E5D|nr:TDP-N-acetylfucosamine:lipid II N-acetylfucosaminyltransferase [Chryseobacterium sp. POL2]QIG90175.1 TDP-N-acetylfucosamine:lipid II N-acetylfucosaminyltransferase [Chryseobacterium sp. POL2]
MRILQLFIDDKFVDSAIQKLSHKDNVINIVISNNDKLNYVKSNNVIHYSTEVIENKFSEITASFDVIFFHSLPHIFRNLIIQHKKKLIYCWFLWGYEYYSEWKIEALNLYEKDESKLNLNNIKDKLIYNNISFKILGNNILKKYYKSELLEAVKKIDYFAPVLPNEYSKIKKLNSDIKYLPYTYGYLEMYIGSNMDIDLSNKKDILLGNSADPSNNHISIIDKLSKINLEDRKVVVPLSYSGNEEYKKKIIDYGHKMLGKNFLALVDFMPMEDYNNIIFNCGYVIFNHIRQQAIGNLIVMGYLGAKIFLNSKSVTSEFLRDNSVIFTPTSKIDFKELNTKMNLEDIMYNKNFIFNYFSKTTVEARTKELFNLIKSAKEQ